MKSIKNISFLIVAFLLYALAGCKKIIDVKLDNSAQKIVVTGEVTNHLGPYKVTISKTIDFASDNIFPPVSGAFVTISENGIADTLQENEPGIYLSHTLKGTPAKSYILNINAEGQTFSAVSKMPEAVALDSIGFMSGRGKNVFPVAYFRDPYPRENYYQFIQYVNGQKIKNGFGNSVFEDRLSNGRFISYVLYSDSTGLKKGDTLTIQMNSIDKPSYQFFSQLQQVSSGSGSGFSSPTPVNPTSNISGDALGYFSAYSISTRQVIVP